jgi:hypothetical protein
VDGAGTAVGDRGADAGGGVTECARVCVTKGEGVDDADAVNEGVDVVGEGVDSVVETPAFPHPTASKATSASAAIFGDVTVGEASITS